MHPKEKVGCILTGGVHYADRKKAGNRMLRISPLNVRSVRDFRPIKEVEPHFPVAHHSYVFDSGKPQAWIKLT